MGIDAVVITVGEVVAATGNSGAEYLVDTVTDAVINIERKTSIPLAMAKFSCRVGWKQRERKEKGKRAAMSISPICCGLNTASAVCSGLSLCMHGASYVARKGSPDAAFGLYLAAQGFGIVADTLDKTVDGPSWIF